MAAKRAPVSIGLAPEVFEAAFTTSSVVVFFFLLNWQICQRILVTFLGSPISRSLSFGEIFKVEFAWDKMGENGVSQTDFGALKGTALDTRSPSPP